MDENELQPMHEMRVSNVMTKPLPTGKIIPDHKTFMAIAEIEIKRAQTLVCADNTPAQCDPSPLHKAE